MKEEDEDSEATTKSRIRFSPQQPPIIHHCRPHLPSRSRWEMEGKFHAEECVNNWVSTSKANTYNKIFYIFESGNVDIVLRNGMWRNSSKFGDLILKVPTQAGIHVLKRDPMLSRAVSSLKSMYKALQAAGEEGWQAPDHPWEPAEGISVSYPAPRAIYPALSSRVVLAFWQALGTPGRSKSPKV
ncbi:hypothetical protein L195_g000886 [Trifolium pratense]|uniref:Uncharacterized protein n=1 Tax=Trifolium pratense TaxID=57577 RepID=A0A2K3NN47_TRIPR|nr:hypothetical protein L195_g000886 [Trifolium pratense]